MIDTPTGINFYQDLIEPKEELKQYRRLLAAVVIAQGGRVMVPRMTFEEMETPSIISTYMMHDFEGNLHLMIERINAPTSDGTEVDGETQSYTGPSGGFT